ncbi:MAG: transglycosylase, partial [Gallionella sp.]
MRYLFCLLLCCTATAYADADADFLAARSAYLAGNIAKLDSIAPRLKKSPFEIYVSYYQLRLQLDTLPTEKVQAFLARPEDNPVIDRLRGEWLKVLGGKQQWALFNKEYPRLIKEDGELTCYALQARHATQPD